MIVHKNKINSWLILLIVIIGYSVYFNSLEVPFLFDDQEYVMDPYLQMETLSTESILNVILYGEAKRRPVSTISIALNYLVSGLNVRGYHIYNITIHVSAAIILFFLIKITLSLPVNREQYKHSISIAFFASLLWLVHPLATQSVTYIIQRMNSMSAMFYLLSVLLYVKARLKQQGNAGFTKYLSMASWLFLGSFLSALLAIGSKEIAVTLPIILFLYEWYFFQNLSKEWILKRIPWLLFAFLTLIFWIFLYLGKNPIAYIIHSCDQRNFTTIERLLTELRVVVHYLGLILYPFPGRLIFDYNFPISTSLFIPITTLLSFFFITALIIVAFALTRKEPLISFCIFGFFLNLVIESSVICVELIFEHRTYLPSTFIILGITALLFRWFKKPIFASLLLIPVISIFMFWTVERNKIYQDPLIFWTDANNKQPNQPRVLNNIGNMYFYKNEFHTAKKYYQKALSIQPEFHHAIKNLGTTFLRLKQYDDAEYYFRHGLELEPEWPDMYNNLATIYTIRQEYDKAISLLRTALHYSPRYPLINKNIGNLLLRTGRTKIAEFFLWQASAYLPNDTTLFLNLAEAKVNNGKIGEGIDVYKHILTLAPDSVVAHYNLARLLSGFNNEQSRFHYEETVRLSPYSIPALYNLANILFREGNLHKAKEYYQRILEITPELANAYNNFGLLLLEEGKYTEAVSLFEQSIKIMPDNELAKSNLKDTLDKIGTDKLQYK